MSQNILLTGGTGYLGSKLIEALAQAEGQIFVPSRHLQDRATLAKHPKVNQEQVQFLNVDTKTWNLPKIDFIIFCHTNYGKDCHKNEVYQTNLHWPQEIILRVPARKIIHLDTALTGSINTYSQSKEELRKWLGHHSNSCSLRSECFYGSDAPSNHFIIWLFIEIMKNQPEIPLTLGEQVREFIHVGDVVAAVQLAMSNDLPQEVYVGGTDSTLTIRDLALKIAKLFGKTEEIFRFGALPYREGERQMQLPTAPSIKKFGWRPRTSLEQGLQEIFKKFSTTKLEIRQ